MPASWNRTDSLQHLVLVVNTVAPVNNIESMPEQEPQPCWCGKPSLPEQISILLTTRQGRADPVRKLGIPDFTGITGRTLGHTVKLPAAVTKLASLGGHRF